MNDEALLRRLQNNQPEALEEMMTRYNKLVYIIIANILGQTGSPSDVEELVSDTFYAVWNHADGIHTGKLKAYLSITARNKAKTFLRSQKELPMDLDEIDIPDSAASPEDEAILKERNRLIKKAINAMRPKDRDIFLRYYYYLQTTDEIAHHTGIPASTVRTRLVRGRKILKKTLSKEALF